MICTLVARFKSRCKARLTGCAASWTAEQELLMRSQLQRPSRGSPQADEAFVLKISAREHLLEGSRQLPGS